MCETRTEGGIPQIEFKFEWFISNIKTKKSLTCFGVKRLGKEVLGTVFPESLKRRLLRENIATFHNQRKEIVQCRNFTPVVDNKKPKVLQIRVSFNTNYTFYVHYRQKNTMTLS